MKTQRLVFVSLVFLFMLGLTSMTFADSAIKGFSLKIGGGAGSWDGSDLNNFYLDFNVQMTNTAGLIVGGDVIGELEELNYGPDFEGEFILELPQNFALGIGIGYLVRSGDSSTEISLYGARNTIAVETRFTAIPILLNGYFNLPVGAKTKLYVKGGVGYYIGKGKYFVRQEQSILGLTPAWEEEEGDASSNAFGFQGGVGIEFNLTETVALFFETSGRYANLKNWEGQNRYKDFLGASESESVEWYYAEEYDDMTRQWYRTVLITEREPSGNYYRNVRKAEISYSGVVLRLGVKISFGKK
ncbi:MAG: outer membrane beta-barrel protein [Candidatus Aminicenantes bacterium]|jgi:opacity protein-like surface antigen